MLHGCQRVLDHIEIVGHTVLYKYVADAYFVLGNGRRLDYFVCNDVEAFRMSWQGNARQGS